MWNEEMAEKIKAHGGSVQFIDELEGKIDKRLLKGLMRSTHSDR